MACFVPVEQQVCLTLVYNIFSGIVTHTLECDACEEGTEFNPRTGDLTIRFTFTVNTSVNISDEFDVTLGNVTISLNQPQP